MVGALGMIGMSIGRYSSGDGEAHLFVQSESTIGGKVFVKHIPDEGMSKGIVPRSQIHYEAVSKRFLEEVQRIARGTADD